jgi:hypothetical protein
LNTDPKFVPRVQAGFLADYLVNEKITLSGGFLFSTKGGKYEGEEMDLNQQTIDVWYSKILTYMDVPLLVNYAASEKFLITGGLQVSFLMDAVYKSSESAQDAFDLDEKTNVKDDYNALDLAPVIGLGYTLTDKLTLLLLYNHGLLKIGHAEMYDPDTQELKDEDVDIKNRVIGLSLKYTFKQ